MPGDQRSVDELFVISHQAGGHHCQQPEFLATPLSLSPAGAEVAAKLARHYFHHQSDHFCGDMPQDVGEYREWLRRFSLTATAVLGPNSGHRLLESVYPLDASSKNLDVLAGGPSALDGLQPILRNQEALARLAIIILADNSD